MPEQILYPTFSTFFNGLSESELADHQSLQVGNSCTFHAITTAIKLLINFSLDPQELSDEIDHLWWRFRPMRVFPGWAVTPHQQVKIVNYVRDKYMLPIQVESSHANLNTLFDNLITPQKASIITLLWGINRAPAIYYGTSPHNYNAGFMPAGHTMLLGSYDPFHTLQDGTPTPWGMVNSWINHGNYLFWLTDEEFTRAWHFFLPFVGPNPLVTISTF